MIWYSSGVQLGALVTLESFNPISDAGAPDSFTIFDDYLPFFKGCWAGWGPGSAIDKYKETM